jgi:predicted nuclease with RNAse H fold
LEVDRSRFKTFVGVDLGGGKGKNTAVALLRAGERGVTVERYDTGGGQPWYDDRLVAFLRQHAADAVVAIDAPLSLTACVRCREPVCPGLDACVDPTAAWFRERANGSVVPGRKPKYTPYTQRATEVVMHEQDGILPRETLGQGMGPLTARAAHLVRALAPDYRLNENLIEVYPKATIWKLLGEETARAYKRWGVVRLRSLLEGLPELAFGPSQWRQKVEWNDHLFDAVICAYTAHLWARDGWQLPVESREVFDVDGWIWSPPRAG